MEYEHYKFISWLIQMGMVRPGPDSKGEDSKGETNPNPGTLISKVWDNTGRAWNVKAMTSGDVDGNNPGNYVVIFKVWNKAPNDKFSGNETYRIHYGVGNKLAKFYSNFDTDGIYFTKIEYRSSYPRSDQHQAGSGKTYGFNEVTFPKYNSKNDNMECATPLDENFPGASLKGFAVIHNTINDETGRPLDLDAIGCGPWTQTGKPTVAPSASPNTPTEPPEEGSFILVDSSFDTPNKIFKYTRGVMNSDNTFGITIEDKDWYDGSSRDSAKWHSAKIIATGKVYEMKLEEYESGGAGDIYRNWYFVVPPIYTEKGTPSSRRPMGKGTIQKLPSKSSSLFSAEDSGAESSQIQGTGTCLDLGATDYGSEKCMCVAYARADDDSEWIRIEGVILASQISPTCDIDVVDLVAYKTKCEDNTVFIKFDVVHKDGQEITYCTNPSHDMNFPDNNYTQVKVKCKYDKGL